MKNIIQIEKVLKFYSGSNEPALNEVSFNIEENEIFGLLGPNGAGKTTLISILSGLLDFNKGRIIISDYDLKNNLEKIKKIIGVVPQDIALFPSLTIYENLRYFGVMCGLDKKNLSSKIEFYISKLDLEKKINKRINTLSGGMKRRVNLIVGILNNPKVLFLDEPTVGIDVHSKSVIIEFLKEINKNNTTIIYTSHQMEEAEKLCTKIAIMSEGAVKAIGKTDELLHNLKDYKNLEEMFLEIVK